MDTAQLTVLTGTIVGLLGLYTGWLQSRRQSHKDYAVVALEGFDKLIDELRAEMTRRDAEAKARELDLTTEVTRLRHEVRTLTLLIKSNGIPLPSLPEAV